MGKVEGEGKKAREGGEERALRQLRKEIESERKRVKRASRQVSDGELRRQLAVAEAVGRATREILGKRGDNK